MKTAIHNTPPKRGDAADQIGEALRPILEAIFNAGTSSPSKPSVQLGRGAQMLKNGRLDRGFLLPEGPSETTTATVATSNKADPRRFLLLAPEGE